MRTGYHFTSEVQLQIYQPKMTDASDHLSVETKQIKPIIAKHKLEMLMKIKLAFIIPRHSQLSMFYKLLTSTEASSNI